MLHHLRLVLSSLCLLAITLSVTAFGSSINGLEAEEAHIKVVEIVNRVETYRPGDEGTRADVFMLAQVGQPLLPGDAVKTFQNSEARIDVVVREFVRITRTTPNTIWRLGQFAVDGSSIIELEQGKVFLFDEGFREGQPDIKVVTPAGTASPRGTWMSVAYDPKTGVTEVQCFRGQCELKNQQGALVMVDEQKSAITFQAAPLQPEAMNQEELESFTELPEARKGEIDVPPMERPIESARPLPAPAIESVPAISNLEPFIPGTAAANAPGVDQGGAASPQHQQDQGGISEETSTPTDSTPLEGEPAVVTDERPERPDGGLPQQGDRSQGLAPDTEQPGPRRGRGVPKEIEPPGQAQSQAPAGSAGLATSQKQPQNRNGNQGAPGSQNPEASQGNNSSQGSSGSQGNSGGQGNNSSQGSSGGQDSSGGQGSDSSQGNSGGQDGVGVRRSNQDGA